MFQEYTYQTEDELLLSYRQYGEVTPEKPTIICLAGLTRNCRSFHSLAKYLQSIFECCVICPDMRGRGKSAYDETSMNYNLLREAQDVIDIIRSKQLRGVIIIGTSRGGILASIIAGMIPSEVKAVILNDVGVTIPMDEMVKLKALFSMNTNFIGDYDSALRAFYNGDQSMTQGLSKQDEAQIIWEIFKHHNEHYYLDYDYQGIGEAYRFALESMQQLNPHEADMRSLFRSLTNIPTLLLRGKNSNLLDDTSLAETQKLLPHIQLQEFENFGHVIYFIHQETLQICAEFLKNHIKG